MNLGIARAVTRSVELEMLDQWRLFASLLDEPVLPFFGQSLPESVFIDAWAFRSIAWDREVDRGGSVLFHHEHAASFGLGAGVYL